MIGLPGSEAFRSLPLARSELRPRVSDAVRLHELGDAAAVDVDALTYEVVRHRLWSITNEMGETLKRMSGSPVVDANDFDFTICDELGYEVQVGLYNTGLAGSMDLAIAWTLQHRADNPGIHDGDMFLCNDPWIGAGLHQNDVTLLFPVFHDELLFCWVTATLHHMDLGGIAPGSRSVNATDVFAESLPTPPLKIVRGLRLQDDVLDAWIRRSRVPLLVNLDTRAQFSANLMARDRMLELIVEFGADTVKSVMQRMMDDAERRLRGKLRELPDGVWESTTYQEHSGEGDRGIYPIVARMIKRQDHLTFDFRGSAEQAGMINCTYATLRASVMMTLLPVLCGDIPWAAGGLMRCYDVVADEGSMIDARFPAAVGKASTGAMWVVSNVVAELMCRMLDMSPDHRHEVQSICAGTYDGCSLSGHDGDGTPFVGSIIDSMAGGFGAKVDRDGVDTGGIFTIPMGRAPDVEMTEFLRPLLYLWRREETDSGGPGRQRGGVSGSSCVVPWGTDAPMRVEFMGSGKATTINRGLAGGLPGCTQLDLIVRGSDPRALLKAGTIPASLEEIPGSRDVAQCEEVKQLDSSDVLYVSWQSGGGYGDPLLRDPQAVAHDVVEDLVSVGAAAKQYGVIVDEAGIVDEAETARHRDGIRQHRRADSGARSPSDRPILDPTLPSKLASNLDDNLVIVHVGGATVVRCRHCEALLGELANFSLDHVPSRDLDVSAGGGLWRENPGTYLDIDVVFRQYYCPGCYTALEGAVSPANHPAFVSKPVLT